MDWPKQQFITKHLGQYKTYSPYLEVPCDHLVHALVEEMTYRACDDTRPSMHGSVCFERYDSSMSMLPMPGTC